MKISKSFTFIKPRFLNILLTVIILCLPILREQYITSSGNILVAWHKPIVVMIDYFKAPQQPHLLLIMIIFILVIYFLASLLILGMSKIIPILRYLKDIKSVIKITDSSIISC